MEKLFRLASLFFTFVANMEKAKSQIIRFIDLFAGIGGIRLGLEEASKALGYDTLCVFTSEIKPHAISVLKQNHPNEEITGDITLDENLKKIPSFDILCAGFPCQAFSAAGNRDGFADETRGTLFFYVANILREHKPKGFILENVEGLVNHDGGNTLRVIHNTLTRIGYVVSYKVLNSKDFGVPQDRKRIYIVGYYVGEGKCSKAKKVSLDNFPVTHNTLSSIIESGHPVSESAFISKLLSLYSVDELQGKSIKDKRGGDSNIHSWDLEVKGAVSDEEKQFLNKLMKERRKKKWASIIGIDWMDGMPLTESQIREFYDTPNLKSILKKLTKQGYLRFEHPKKKVVTKHTAPNGKVVETSRRIPDTSKPKGYNIVAGKLSFEVGKVLSPNEIAPTLVATDMHHLFVVDGQGIRQLSLSEGLKLFGYPEGYKFDIPTASGYDLLGNTVVVPVIKAVAYRLLEHIYPKV